jgi:hypothetical protein
MLKIPHHAHLITVVDLSEGVEQGNVLHRLCQCCKQLGVALQIQLGEGCMKFGRVVNGLAMSTDDSAAALLFAAGGHPWVACLGCCIAVAAVAAAAVAAAWAADKLLLLLLPD